ADGTYVLCIAHLGYRGGSEYVYRLNLTAAPYPVFAFPPGGRAGETVEIGFFALTGQSSRHAPRAVDGTQSVPTTVTGGDVLQSWKEAVTFPASARPGTHFAVHGVPLEVSESRELIAGANRSAG